MIERPPGLFSRLSQQSLVIVAVVWFAYDFALKAGAQLPQYGAQLPEAVVQRIAETTSKVEANERMLRDLHAGIAPRDSSQTPIWAVLRQGSEHQIEAIKRLTEALERNTRSNYELLYIERGEPETRGATTTPQPAPEPHSWLDRLREWMWWDAAG